MNKRREILAEKKKSKLCVSKQRGQVGEGETSKNTLSDMPRASRKWEQKLQTGE